MNWKQQPKFKMRNEIENGPKCDTMPLEWVIKIYMNSVNWHEKGRGANTHAFALFLFPFLPKQRLFLYVSVSKTWHTSFFLSFDVFSHVFSSPIAEWLFQLHFVDCDCVCVPCNKPFSCAHREIKWRKSIFKRYRGKNHPLKSFYKVERKASKEKEENHPSEIKLSWIETSVSFNDNYNIHTHTCDLTCCGHLCSTSCCHCK